MIKLIALFTIVICSGLFGLTMAQRHLNRPKQLRGFHRALSALETEISYGATALPQALNVAATGLDPEIARFFQTVGAKIQEGTPAGPAWQLVCDQLKPGLCLHAEDWKIVRGVGIGLGTTDRLEEKKKLNLACARILSAEEDAKEKGGKLARLWGYMGFLAGAAIALVIW